MKLYRVNKNLTSGEGPGAIVREGRFDERFVRALLANGAMSEIVTPPLSELRGWELRSEKLAAAGIVTIAEFLAADDETLMQAFNHKTNRGVKKYRAELEDFLDVSFRYDVGD